MRTEVSAGGVITRDIKGEVCILLAKHRGDTYGFPKGHQEVGETLRQTAKREIIEETGLQNFRILKQLGAINRSFVDDRGVTIHRKIVMFRISVSDYHQDESEEITAWIPLKDAGNLFRYPQDRDFFDSIKATLDKA